MKTIRRTGFTLLDTIIVTAIMALIAGMGAPKLAVELRRRTTATAADQLVTAHSLARATAVRYGRTAQLHIDATAKRFWVDVDTSANLIGQRATIWYARDISESGVTISSTRSLLCFDARGIASTAGTCQAGNAQVVFTDVDRADTVATTLLGKVLR